ncbi:porin family protein, partial [candidate division KSB1 bacterium]
MKRALFVTMLLAASFASAVETWDNRFNIGGHANIIKFWGGAVNHSALGWQLGGHALYGITPNVQIGLEAGYGCFRPSATGRLIPAADDLDFRTLALPVNLVVRAGLPTGAAIKPYGVLGLGAVRWDLQNNDKDSPDYGESVHGQRTNATALVGIGAEWFFNDSWALDARAQNAFLLNQKLDNTGYGDDVNSMMFQGRVGISFYFGGQKDEKKPPLQSSPPVVSPAVELEEPLDTAPREVVPAEPPPPPPPVEEIPDAAPEAEVIPDQVDAALVLQGVNFEFNKDELTSQARLILDNVTKKLQD